MATTYAKRMRTYRRKAKIAPSEELHSVNDAIEPSNKWTILKFLVSWLNCLIVPILIGILQNIPLYNEIALAGFFCDMINGIELIILALPRYLEKYFNRIQKHESQYLYHSKLSFCLNLISACPLLVVPIARACGGQGMTLAWLCAPRMMQIGEVVRTFHSLKRSLPRDSIFRNGTVSRVALVFVLASIHASMLACVWFLISCPNRHDCPTANAWVAEDHVLIEDTYFSDYIRSLHFVVQTLFTVGYGDIAPRSDREIIFALFLVLNGSLFYGFLISSITSLISNKDISTKLFRSDMATLRQFLTMRDVPQELSTRVEGLFNFLFNRQAGLLESKFMDDLPVILVREIKRTYTSQLMTIPFFLHQSTRLVRHVMDRMVLRSYVPKAIVFFQNERKRELYVIRSGKLDIKVRSSPNALFSYMEGEYVGDFQLIFGTPSEVTVESGAYTEVLVLTFEALVEAISSSGEVAKGEDFEKWLMKQQSSLEDTVVSHKQLLLRVIKVRTSMEEIKKKNKFVDMMADAPTEKPRFVILPGSIFRPVWCAVVASGIIYYMLMTPFRILAHVNCGRGISVSDCLLSWDWSLLVDYAVDLIFVADTILRAFLFAFTRFEAEQHVVVTDKREIFSKFASSKLLFVTVLGILPFDLISLFTGYLLCIRMIKVVWAFLLFENISDFLLFFEHRLKRPLISTEGITVVHLGIIALFVCLWTSICWSLIHLDNTSAGFVESVYWCLTTMTTVGYGDIVASTNTMTVFVVAACIVCPCTCATIIGTASSYVHNTDTSVDNISHRKLVTVTFLNSTVCGNELSTDVAAVGKDALAYIDHVERERRGLDEQKIMSTMLPDYMQEDIRQFLVMDVILSLPIFSCCDSGFVRQIMLAVVQHVVMASADILTPGISPEGMYIVQSGLVQVLTAQGRKTQKLSRGDTFAESSLFDDSILCNFKFQAHTNCEIWILKRSCFDELVREIGLKSMTSTLAQMQEFAKTAAKKMVETPAPTIRALQVIHELGAIDSDSIIIIKPRSLQYNMWAILISAVILYDLLTIPARLALMEGVDEIKIPSAVLDYLGDLLLILDIVLRSVSLAYMERQEIIMSKSKIWTHYLETRFMLHICASIPLDILVLCGMLPGLSFEQSLMFYRLNKLLRIVDIPALVESIENCFLSRSTSMVQNTVRVLKLMFVVFLAAHLVGCLFFAIANHEHKYGNANNWADVAGILRPCSFNSAHNDSNICSDETSFSLMMTQYMYSVYWAAATLTTVGYGDVAAVSTMEQILAIFVFTAGSAVYTMVITNLQDIVSHLDVTSDLFKSRRNRIDDLLIREKAPTELIRKASAYLDRLWQIQCGAQGKEIQQFLAPNVYSEIVLKLIKRKLDAIFFVKQCSRGFQLALTQKMDLQHYMIPDFIYHTGEAAMSLYVLVKGDVALVCEDTGQQYSKVFGDKGILGESEFFTRACYSCGAEVKNDVTSYEISYTDFWFLVEEYRLQNDYTTQMRTSYVNLYKNSCSNMVNTLNGNFKNSKMVKMMSVKQLSNVTEFAILPGSLIARLWVIFCLMLIVYQALTVPYYIALSDDIFPIALMDALVSGFFIIDIYLNLRYFAVEDNGTLISTRNEFSSRYIDNFLKRDIVCTLPIALFLYGVTGDTTTFVITRLLHLIRIDKINEYINRIIGIVESHFQIRMSSDSVRVGKTILVVWYFGHVTACVFCGIGLMSPHTWIAENDFTGLPSISIYLRGYLWSMYTIITVGYGSIELSTNVERAFAVCVMIMGAILCDAGMTAVLSSIIGNADKQSGLTRRSREAMLKFCESNKMGDTVVEKVNIYYDYLSESLNNNVESQDFQFLPKPILLELIQFGTFDAICSLYLLDVDSSEQRLGFVYSLIRYAEPTIALPNQVILNDDDDNDIHVLRQGRAYARYFRAQDSNPQKDYFQEGEALCREGRLNTSSFAASGKYIKVLLRSVNELSLGPNFTGPFGFSSVYARIGVGARKARSSMQAISRGSVKWKELFAFHAPKAASSLQILLFSETEREDGGFIGSCNIQLDELESIEVHDSSHIPDGVDEGITIQRRRHESIPDSRRVVTFTNGSAGRLDSLPDFTNTSTSAGGLNSGDGSVQNFCYNIKQDLRDKNGRLKGILDLEITMRNMGVSDDARGKNTYLKCRQKSTKPVEIIAETVCHMYTIEGAKLTELREYYWNYTNPARKVSIGTGGLSKRRRKSSFVHSSMIDIMKRHMPESSKENLMAGAATGDATSQVHNEEKEVNIDGEPTPSLSDNRHSAGYSRRGGMQNAHRSSECMRTGEHLIIANAPRDLKISVTTVAEHIDEIGKSDAEEEEECDVECRGNVTTGDISEGEMHEAFGLSPLLQNLRSGNATRTEFLLSWKS